MNKKGVSLHIGLNHFDSSIYGNNGQLNGCVNDANDMQSIAESQGFETTTLTDKEATRDHIIRFINQVAAQLNNGDTFLLTFSGHGTFIPDHNNDEVDGYDEAWCLYDGLLIDDELKVFWSRFKAGVKISIFSDSCHSGTIAKEAINLQKSIPKALSIKTIKNIYNKNKSLYEEIQQKHQSQTKNIKAGICLISGCQDNQYSGDLPTNGVFTGRLKQVWNNGHFSGDFKKFHQVITRGMPSTQSPNFLTFGQSAYLFERQKPFSL